MASPAKADGGETKRFRAKRDAILAAASEAINQQSAKGMTFADIARRVGLNTTSVTYYFKRKEDLAAACYDNSLDRLAAMTGDAAQEATPEARVAKLLALDFARLARIARGEETAFAGLSDLRAMDDAERPRLIARWQDVFRLTRDFWKPADAAQKDLAGARAHVLLEALFWLPVWLNRYDLDQYPRVEARFREILTLGIAGGGERWSPAPLTVTHDHGDPNREAFLKAATRLINIRGYRGASVQRIASELNVTKGSFYHHLDAKDDLVIACYDRSFETIREAQDDADTAGGSHWARLTSTVSALLAMQFSEDSPLLRTTQLHGLPPPIRSAMVARSNRAARRFSGMISDGVAEGSCRAVDPEIASQVLMSLVNAAFDFRKWAGGMARDRAVAMYASTVLFGLFDDRALT